MMQFSENRVMRNRCVQSDKPRQPIWRVVLSTLAAAVGVQSNKNRERDFSEGNLVVYVLSGLVFTALFVGGLIFLVNRMLSGT